MNNEVKKCDCDFPERRAENGNCSQEVIDQCHKEMKKTNDKK